jgi:hypothetical protein
LGEEMQAYLLGARADGEMNRRFGLDPAKSGADERICQTPQKFNEWADFMPMSENIAAYGTRVYTSAEVKELQKQTGCT